MARDALALHARAVSPRPVAVIVAGLIACGACGSRGSPGPVLPAAGATDPADDGVGQLARASVKYMTGKADAKDTLQEFPDDERRGSMSGYDEYGGYQYGGDSYGGVYGGQSYASYNPVVTNWNPVNRQLDYTVHSLTDAGAVAGTVTWTTAPGTRKVSSPCGEIDNPTLRLGAHGEAGGAVVYLEGITKGKSVPIATKPVVVGGTIEKVACAMRPTTQVLAPAPGTATVYNDSTRGVVMQRGPKTDPISIKLAPGGYKQVGVATGVTSFVDEGATLVPAWIVAPGHPYVAMTDDAGRFKISDIVPGTYKLVVWHAPVVTSWRDGKPQFGAPTIVTRTIKVGAYATAKADVALK